MEMSVAVNAAMASVRGEANAAFRSAVRRSTINTIPAIGIDQMMR